jgi:hypothetical protein
MSIDDLAERYDGSDLLQFLVLSGWTIRRTSNTGTALRALRDGVQVSARAASFPEAAGSLFIRAMRAGAASPRGRSAAKRRQRSATMPVQRGDE